MEEFLGGLVGFVFALLAFLDCLGDGGEHLAGGMVTWIAAGGVFVAFDELLEVSGVDVTVYVFLVYLCGCFPIAGSDLCAELIACVLGYHFFMVMFGNGV